MAERSIRLQTPLEPCRQYQRTVLGLPCPHDFLPRLQAPVAVPLTKEEIHWQWHIKPAYEYLHHQCSRKILLRPEEALQLALQPVQLQQWVLLALENNRQQNDNVPGEVFSNIPVQDRAEVVRARRGRPLGAQRQRGSERLPAAPTEDGSEDNDDSDKGSSCSSGQDGNVDWIEDLDLNDGSNVSTNSSLPQTSLRTQTKVASVHRRPNRSTARKLTSFELMMSNRTPPIVCRACHQTGHRSNSRHCPMRRSSPIQPLPPSPLCHVLQQPPSVEATWSPETPG